MQVEIDRLRKDIEVAVEETKRHQKKLVDKADEVEARKALFDRLAKAVREKRYDDALKLVEEVDKANETPKTK